MSTLDYSYHMYVWRQMQPVVVNVVHGAFSVVCGSFAEPRIHACNLVCGRIGGLEHRHLKDKSNDASHVRYALYTRFYIDGDMASQAGNVMVDSRENGVPGKMKALQ
jgi:hypothetical protein